MKALKMCLNWKVIAGVAAVGGGIFVFAPDIAAAALPFLILAICPLSMIFMMGAMNSMNKGTSTADSSVGGASLGRGDQLAQLRLQQRDIADKIAALETESDATTRAGGQVKASTYTG